HDTAVHFFSQHISNTENYTLSLHDALPIFSQWGYDFRPDYLRIVDQMAPLGNPPILGLTATASETVRLDIKKALNKPHMTEIIYPIDRENIIMNVEMTNNETDKRNQM